MIEHAAAGLLVVTPARFQDDLEPYLAWRRDDMPVVVMTLENAVETHDGVDDAEKLKHAIHETWQANDIRYVLLVGDADVMPVRYMCLDRKTGPAFNYAFYPTDLYYADLVDAEGEFCDWNARKDDVHALYFGEVRGEHHKDDPINYDQVDYRPEVGLGRWPVSTPEDLRAVIEKTIAFDRQIANATHPGRDRSAFLMVDGWIDARPNLDRMIESLGDAWTTTRRYYGSEIEPSREVSVDLFNDGHALVVHAGHGHDNGWEDCLEASDIERFTNTDRIPIVLSAGCSTARFATLPPYEPYRDHTGVEHVGTDKGQVFDAPPPPPDEYARGPYNRSGLGEKLVRAEGRGAVAYFGCNTGSQPCALTLVGGFVEGIAPTDHRLGDAWAHAIDIYVERERLESLVPTSSWYPASIYFQGMKFMLFGDPSLRLHPDD